MDPASKEIIAMSHVDKAKELVNGERQGDYGHPFDDFSKTAKMWEALKPGVEFTPEDVALFMVCVKLSREVNQPKEDNIVDAHGYLLTYEMVKRRREEMMRSDTVGDFWKTQKK